MRKRTVIAKDSAKPDLAFLLCGLASTPFSMPFMLNFFCLSLRAILAGQLHVSFPHVALAVCPGGSPPRFMPAFRPVISPGRAQGPMGPRRAWKPSWPPQAFPPRPTSEKPRPDFSEGSFLGSQYFRFLRKIQRFIQFCLQNHRFSEVSFFVNFLVTI